MKQPEQPADGHGLRRQRFFGHGELRLVLLEILSRSDSHGYELIKEVECLTQGRYAPSPGVIYPTLDQLQAQGLVTVADAESGRRKIAITEAGRSALAAQQQPLDEIHRRLQARNLGHALRKDPQMKRALENFKAVLDLKINQQPINDAQLKKIIAVIDGAAMEISQLP